jgi:hypothetical protein
MKSPVAGWANVWSLKPIGDGAARNLIAPGIAVSRVLLVIACYFSWGPLATTTEAGSPGHDLRLQNEAKSLETRREADWVATANCAADKQGATDGDGSRCFPLVIYNAGCSGSRLQLQPKVEREVARRQAHGFEFSFRFAAVGMTRHIPYRIERELAFLRLR